ncbi:polysaccharide pyruvyl transferase family protein [Flavimaricola marinus]|uniref:Polysaccharide pyruvyl transferase n=1 Tax=Flavimaricola marinus TaxID=1819565 RepID=A0A238LHV6_9RHOB|nr:polysaccharide pyruvyl transferase family protein [Flavimaricola marinus]SMY09231.1 Polysaccharide pyruvyl transferase [Flavimaricola marinus]
MPAHFAFLGTSGRVRRPQRFPPEVLLSVLGANSGNLMFQYAASRIIDAPGRHIGLSDISYTDPRGLEGAQALIFPAANHLRTGVDWSGLNDYLAGADLPLVVLGLGAQATAGATPGQTITALKSAPSVLRMVDILRDRAVFVSVRGAFSQEVCAGLGLDRVEVLGCPSALLNPDPGLGRSLAARLQAARQMPSPRIAVTAAAPFEIALDTPRRKLERRLFGWAQDHDGLYVQQSGGLAAMQATSGQWHRISEDDRASIAWVLDPEARSDAAGNPHAVWNHLRRHGRFYTSAADWIAEMGPLDVVLGSRAHGTMAALAAGTPGVLIAHDSRTSELAQTMHLPQLDAEAVLGAGTLADALSHVRFDGAAFDRWRTRTAATLTAAFDRLDIPVAGPVRALGTAP